MIEYFDGNPVREEVFLEGEPRSLGEHDGHLIRRDGGGEVTVTGTQFVGDAIDEDGFPLDDEGVALRENHAGDRGGVEEVLHALQRHAMRG